MINLEYGFILLGYLFGSIPFGLVLCKIAGYGDIRDIGSGNIGATNVLRTGNKLLASLTLLGDVFKGGIAVWVSFISADAFIILATGLFAVLGHMYPVWLKFKGGKGVATTLGTMLAIMPLLCAIMCAIWLAMALIFRISSLAALTAFAAAPVIAYTIFNDQNLALLSGILALLVFWRHKGNIERLLKGEEPRIGKKKDKHDPSQSKK